MKTDVIAQDDKAALDPVVLGAFFNEHGVECGPDGPQWSLLAGGRSNLTYVIKTAAGDFILRRPPLGHTDPRAHDVGREFRILRALHPQGLPVPRPLAYCDDPALIGSRFYIMERVHGRVAETTTGNPDLLTAANLQALADTVVDGLVAVHAADPVTSGLGDIGKPQGFAVRQVKRWTQGWAERQQRKIPALDEAARRLVAGVAGGLALDPDAATIVHGDYNITNMLISNAGETPELRAILDWEMSALGHPMMDLGLLMTYNQFQNRIFVIDDGLTQHPDFPSSDYFTQRYAVQSHRSVELLDFFRALALFKIIVLGEDVRARFEAGTTRGEGYETQGTFSMENSDALLDLMNRSTIKLLRQ